MKKKVKTKVIIKNYNKKLRKYHFILKRDTFYLQHNQQNFSRINNNFLNSVFPLKLYGYNQVNSNRNLFNIKYKKDFYYQVSELNKNLLKTLFLIQFIYYFFKKISSIQK